MLPLVKRNYHPFTEAFNSWKDHVGDKKVKKIRTFDELKDSIQQWGKGKVPLTKTQERAIAIEGEKIGITAHVREEKYFRKGKIQTRYRDVVTSLLVKNKDVEIGLPSWRRGEYVVSKGVKIHIETGEKIIMRRENGTYLKKSEWRYIDAKGNERKVVQ